jgi:hypothetical protein
MKTVREFANKEEAERCAFLRFATLINENSWTSVTNTKPPQPDLLCKHNERGFVAFELVAITDPKIAQVSSGYVGKGESSFYTTDPTERIIRKKLGRSYETPYPIELLVYNDLLTLTPDDVIVEIASNWLDSKDHPFVRAWYMGEFHAIPLWAP